MQQYIPTCQASSRCSIILRHAERHPIDVMTNALAAKLTEQGKLDAYSFGRNLARSGPITLYHSPVPRCAQTAECIYGGINSIQAQATLAGHLLDLGGPYITGNWNQIAKLVEELGHSIFVRKWFDNRLSSDIIMPLPDAAAHQLGILLSQLRSGPGTTVNITHDWNIMILREYYLHLRHEDVGDPDYLDGLSAFIINDAVHLRYHDHETILDLSKD